MKMKLLLSIFLSALFVISCDDFKELDAPVPGSTSGNANFSRFVTIGNSITAGYQSGTIYQSGQIYSYGNLIAQRVGTEFQMPLVSDPGLGGRMEVVKTSPFTLYTNPSKGSLLNASYNAPYNNLGVPGALTYDVLYATNSTNCASAVFANSPNPYFDVILRNSTLNKGTQLQQALALAPTFITLWIGNNDVLGYATSGGTSPAAPTSVGQFQQLYGGIVQGLQQYIAVSGAKVAVANIPSVTAIPFFTTVGSQIAAGLPWAQLPLGFVYQKAGESGIGSGSASQSNMASGQILVTLRGSSYASLIGQPTGKFYKDNKFPALPAGIDTTKPFGVHPQNPFPNAFVLDADEIATAQNTVASYNAHIASLANANGYALVDINTAFNTYRQNDLDGTIVNGITFKTTYVSGGLFSLDGVHPTSQAHGIIANEFIKAINAKFGAKIQPIDVSAIPGSLYFQGKVSYKNGYPIIPKEVLDNVLF